MPPTTTGALTPSASRHASTSGTSSRWLPDRIDRPITSTSSSRAVAAMWLGVSRMPSYTTSMPASRAATATCSAPLEWPSRPGLATSTRGGPPSIAAHRWATAASAVPLDARPAPAPPKPVGARNSPNTSRRAWAHSPVVTPAWAASMLGPMMFTSPDAATRRSSRAATTRFESRAPRQRSRSATSSASVSGSTRRIDSSPSSGDGAVSVNSFTPTTVSSLASIWRTRSVWLATRRRFSSVIAAKAPPMASTSSSSACAASISSAVRPSTTTEPSKMSPYSSRSVSCASTC